MRDQRSRETVDIAAHGAHLADDQLMIADRMRRTQITCDPGGRTVDDRRSEDEPVRDPLVFGAPRTGDANWRATAS